MHPVVRAKVTRNMSYHQQLADYYGNTAAEPKAEADTQIEEVTPESQYLADLHANVAAQLREVLNTVDTPAILDTTSPVIRPTGFAGTVH